MKYAVCLYGQPRDYKLGYLNIKNFIENNNGNTFEFFIHCWGDNNVLLGNSPWRRIDRKTLYIENMEQIKKDLIHFYNPCKYEFEKPIKKFDLTNIKNSIAYKNMREAKKNNIHNTLSQIYSRNKVRDILHDYLKTVDTKYDMVITMRIDYTKDIKFKLKNIVKNKIYVSAIHRKRLIIPDNFIVCPIEKYLKWFNLYKNMQNIINNKELEYKINNINEKLELNMEEYLLANYLYYYNTEDIIYSVSIGSAF